ncbi:hypothetical protein BACCAP_00547 [Pseudoflavonifractor capillosus ATCC 29799]|uniref:Uncharacterized protein n=1 Tax=Pseudoflavonifractor capillosus ATCC 29799 TaxID=411467 RepID=A6NQS6_9FIRM|nr:hypothetical protein BACCAP_00547 [Pseudoflavonifractor capillosus ATCC 29799]
MFPLFRPKTFPYGSKWFAIPRNLSYTSFIWSVRTVSSSPDF